MWKGCLILNFQCPVCLFDRLPYPPSDYHICVCCGTEFGTDDVDFTHEELLREWIDDGAVWFYQNPPAGWNPWVQLANGGRVDLVPVLSNLEMQEFFAGTTDDVDRYVYGDANESVNGLPLAMAASSY